MNNPSHLTGQHVALVQRSNHVRVQAERTSWPAWALDGLTHTETLAEALAVAEPGATVLVAPGTYVESLAPTRPVTIVAESPGSVVVDGGQAEWGLLLDADVAVEVRGLTFRLRKPDQEQVSEAVAVRRGHLELADCRIEAFDSTDTWSPEGLAVGAPVSGRTAPDAEDGPIAPDGSVAAADPAPADTAGDAEGAADAELARAVTVVLRRCKISSDAVGITIRGAHAVSVWDSEIVGREAGLSQQLGGRAELVATTIRGCERGIRLGGPAASASLEACTLADNERPFAFDGGADAHQVELQGTNVR